VRGVLVFSHTLTPGELPYRDLAGLFAVSVACFAIASGFIGTIFGFFTARGLTRRLGRMTTAAAAWSEGDFARVIADRSADEIGQLGRQLNRMAGQLDELIRSRQQLSVVNERNRLARDLHDSVKQQVFAISMNLGAAQELWEHDPAAARGRVAAAFDLARRSQQELTTIIRTLRPVELEGKGVRQALREYVARWPEQSGVAATWASEGDGALPLPVEEALFRVTQEALANVARHSGAGAAHVTLRTRPGLAELAVCDDGHGFDAAARPAGVGLQSMRERVEAVHGSLAVTSGAGGTTLVARVPLAGEGERT
jgi:NarL family two-component system sensor histidine kinase LiaS